MSLLLYSSYLIEMHYTWQMLGWTGQSLRETTGTIYYTREMKEKGNKTSTTLPQCLTAASYISRGGGGAWKGGSGCYSSLVTCLFLFTLSVRLFEHNFICHLTCCHGVWSLCVIAYTAYDHHLTSSNGSDIGRLNAFFFAHGHRCWGKSSKLREEFQWYLPWIGKWIAAMFIYYTLLHWS